MLLSVVCDACLIFGVCFVISNSYIIGIHFFTTLLGGAIVGSGGRVGFTFFSFGRSYSQVSCRCG